MARSAPDDAVAAGGEHGGSVVAAVSREVEPLFRPSEVFVLDGPVN